MKIKDLLENFYGNDIWVEIRDKHLHQNSIWRKNMAIEKYGYCLVTSWTMENNNIIINTSSQF